LGLELLGLELLGLELLGLELLGLELTSFLGETDPVVGMAGRAGSSTAGSLSLAAEGSRLGSRCAAK
jgi:hypothetical protein